MPLRDERRNAPRALASSEPVDSVTNWPRRQCQKLYGSQRHLCCKRLVVQRHKGILNGPNVSAVGNSKDDISVGLPFQANSLLLPNFKTRRPHVNAIIPSFTWIAASPVVSVFASKCAPVAPFEATTRAPGTHAPVWSLPTTVNVARAGSCAIAAHPNRVSAITAMWALDMPIILSHTPPAVKRARRRRSLLAPRFSVGWGGAL